MYSSAKLVDDLSTETLSVFYALALSVLLILLALYLITDRGALKTLVGYAPFWLLLMALIAAFYIFNVRFQTPGSRRYYIKHFVVLLPLMTLLFKVKQQNGDGLDLIYKYSDITCAIALLSLVVYLASVFHVDDMPSDVLYSRWSDSRSIHERVNLLNICQLLPGSKWQTGNISLLRNYGFFVEPLMFSIPLITALGTELFLRKADSGRGIARSVLLTATIVSASTTIGMALTAMLWAMKGVLACLHARKRALALIVACAAALACVALVAGKASLSYETTEVSGSSIAYHLEDIKAGVKAFIHSPLVGGGYRKGSYIRQFMSAEKRANNPGFSSTAAVVLGEGGLMLGLLCTAPFFICFLYLFRRRDKRAAMWALGLAGLFVGVVFTSRIYLLFIMAAGYSLVEVVGRGRHARFALSDLGLDSEDPSDEKGMRGRGSAAPVALRAGLTALAMGLTVWLGVPLFKGIHAFLRIHQFSITQSPIKAFCLSVAVLFNVLCVKQVIGRRVDFWRLPALAAWDVAYMLIYPVLYSDLSTLLSGMGIVGHGWEAAALLAAYFAGGFVALFFDPGRWLRGWGVALSLAGVAAVATLAVLIQASIGRMTPGASEALVEALKPLTEAAVGRVYVNDAPSVYRRLNGAVSRSTTRDSGFDAGGDVSIVYRAGSIRPELLENGFEVAKLTDGYLVYSNDAGVISELSAEGIVFYRYYPFDQEVDLKALARKSKLKRSAAGAIVVPAGASVGNGPSDTLRSGLYTADYELKIDPKDFADADSNTLVCRLSVSKGSGDAVVAQKDVTLDMFSARGRAVITLPFGLSAISDSVYYGLDNCGAEEVRLKALSVRETPEYITARRNNCHNMPVYEAYYRTDGSAYFQRGGYCAVQRRYSLGDMIVSVRYLGTDGRLRMTTDGYAEVRYGYNGKRSKAYEGYFGEAGEPVRSNSGYASMRTTYDAYGNPLSVRYFDERGELVNTAYGYAELRQEYNVRRQLVREFYFDRSGAPAVMYGQYSGIYREYDDAGRVALQCYLDAESKPVTVDTGFASWRQEYDDVGRVILTAYYDEAGQPTVYGTVGYASVRFEYNERGGVSAERYYGVSGEPVLGYRQYHMVRRTFDENGLAISESYYGTDGRLTNGVMGFARVERRYNDHGKVTEELFFGSDGSPARIGVGYSRTAYTYDADENVSLIYYLDDAGNRLEAGSGYLHEYLSALAGKNYTVFIAAKDEATSALTGTLMEDFRRLGIATNLLGKTRYSYYAVVSPEGTVEEASYESKLEHSGTVGETGEPYYIASAGHQVGNSCSISIGGVEYSKNARGMNIVVYDGANGAIVDAVAFDTYDPAMTVTR